MSDTHVIRDLGLTAAGATGTCGCGGCGCGQAGSGGAAQAHGGIQTVVGVEGMSCGHCVTSVTEELQELGGVTAVDIELVAGGVSTVTVTSMRVLDRDEISTAVSEAGYHLARRTS